MAFPYSKGRNNNFFLTTSKAKDETAPRKGNLIGRKERAVSPVVSSTAGSLGKGYQIPNQGVNRSNEPPKSANWQGLSRPYQADMGLHGKRFRK